MSPSNIPPVSSAPVPPSGTQGQVVQIVSLPEGLQNNARAIRLQGEVIQQNDNGSIRVRTPQGDIDINVRGRQPQQGQKIDIDVPPGAPPKQATIQPTPTQAPKPQQQQPLPQTPPATTMPQPPVTRPDTPPPATGGTAQPLPPATGSGKPQTIPPAQDVYQPVQAKPAQPVTALPPLSPGQAVKLVPYLPTQAPPALADKPGQGLPAMPENLSIRDSITPQTSAKANTIAAKGEGNLITTLLNAVKSALPQNMAMPPLQTKPAQQQAAVPAFFQTPKPVPSVFFAPPVLSAKIESIILPSGQTLIAPSVAAAPVPAAATSSIPQSQPAQTNIHVPSITVTVTEITPQQQPIIPIVMNNKGAVQNFVLQSPPASVPVGTQVTLQPQISQNVSSLSTPNNAPPVTPFPPGTMSLPASASQLPPAWRSLLPLMQPASVWPAMDDLFQTFYQATPQAAQVMGRTIPSPSNGANFGPAVMLFAAALKSGDLQGWIGDKKLEMIQKLGKDSILSRLSGETSSLAANNDAAATDWKSFPIPMLWQNEISKVMFHVRKEPSENEQEQGEDGTRFVMDLSLTRMGDVQLDGLVRGKRLDLIVRTQLPVSSMMQEAMAAAYATALDGTDIYGEIGFQSDRTNWENILERQDMLITSSV